jgi:protein gp37
MPTPIEWCDETFNPWWGCERVSPGCAHCYADTLATRYGFGETWGDGHGFRFFGGKHWDEPLKWARLLPAKLGRRPRVFCASMADVFEERPELEGHRARLFSLIHETPELDWLILTKRPEFARDWLSTVSTGDRRDPVEWLPWNDHPLPNVWLGVSIENARYTWRADVLREIPAAVRFISAEPLLGSLYDREGTWTKAQRQSSGTLSTRLHASSSDASARRRDTTSTSSSSPAATIPSTSSAAGAEHRGESSRRSNRAPLDLTGIDWVIVGGESGPKARPISRHG